MKRTMMVLAVSATALLMSVQAVMAQEPEGLSPSKMQTPSLPHQAQHRVVCADQPDGRCAGTARADDIVGTFGNETIRGLDGADLIRGIGGSDTLVGGNGADTIVAARCGLGGGAGVRGGAGNDQIGIANDCGLLAVFPPPDRVDCGPGTDVVRGVRRGFGRDRIAANCERVIAA